MDNAQFYERVQQEFGAKLEHATPANMRQFLYRMYEELSPCPHDEGTFLIPREDASNYEQVVSDFLARVLQIPPERAVVLLWIFASELFYARLGEQYDQSLRELLRFDITE